MTKIAKITLLARKLKPLLYQSYIFKVEGCENVKENVPLKKTFLDFSERTFVVWNLGGPKGFQFPSISGFFLKNFCGLGFFHFLGFYISKSKNSKSKF